MTKTFNFSIGNMKLYIYTTIISVFCFIFGYEAISLCDKNESKNCYTIKVDPDTVTIKEIKDICLTYFGNQKSKLIIEDSNGVELSDEGSALKSYNISNSDSLFYIMNQPDDTQNTAAGSINVSQDHDSSKLIRISVNSILGWSITLEIKSNETVKDLKSMIEHLEDIPIEVQKLFFGNEKLDDNQQLKSYNIKSDSIIHLIHEN